MEFLTGRRGIISTWGGTAERLLTRAGHNVIAALVMAALVSLPASAQERVTLSALVGNPDQYDGKVIAVTGVVAAYRGRRSREADPYTIFRLREGRASVVVIAWPHQGLRDGLRVQVTGTFVKVKTFLFIKAQSTIVLPHRPDPSGDWSLRSFTDRLAAHEGTVIAASLAERWLDPGSSPSGP